MQVITVLGGAPLGADARLSLNADFKCLSTSCYGIGAVDLIFRDLQTQLNRLAGVAGFTKLAVDGKLGAGTVSAVKAVYQYAVKRQLHTGSGGARVQELTTALSPQLVAQSAAILGAVVRDIADGKIVAGGGAPPSTPASPNKPATPTAPAPVPKADPHEVGKLPVTTPQPNVERTVVERTVTVEDTEGKKRLYIAGGAVAALLTVSSVVAWAALRRPKTASRAGSRR